MVNQFKQDAPQSGHEFGAPFDGPDHTSSFTGATTAENLLSWLKEGLSQTVAVAAEVPAPPVFSGFVNFLKSETESDQFILPTDCPVAGEAEALAQPQQRLEARDRTSRRRETA